MTLQTEKEVEPTEAIHKQARETQSRVDGKELPVLKNSHEHSSPSEICMINKKVK